MEETISLQDLFRTLKKRIGLIFMITILAMGVAAVVSYFFMTPIYQSSTQILVNQKADETNQFNQQAIQTNLQLINTYNVIIKSPAILSKVIEQLDLETTPAELNGQLTVNSAQNSQVVSLTVQDENPYRSVDIANTTAEVFQAEIKTLMNVDNVNILSPAIPSDNPSPVKPRKLLNIAIAAIVGLMLGVGLAFLLEYLDTTVKTEQDIEEFVGLPLLGIVSKLPDEHFRAAASSRRTQRSKEKAYVQ
ncbi:YveK family protein [Sporosarcina sp. ITBMC105]